MYNGSIPPIAPATIEAPATALQASDAMCGINGIFWLDADTPRPAPDDIRCTLTRMNDAVAHRGPDGQGVYLRDQVALGHRRLSIIDLTANAAQPMCSDDGAQVVVFNGEIYNYRELTNELTSLGHRFRTASDTEVILHAYEQWGTDCVTRFNGMWAFALYDARRRRLFCSRDRLGVKPFYFLIDRERLVFSSEMKAIILATDARDANLGKVYDYLAYGYRTSNGDTFFRDIHELPPATNMVVEGGHVSKCVYWKLPEARLTSEVPSLNDLADSLRALLKDAIKLRFRSDVPVAVLLSGGLDSTAITRTVDDVIAKGELGWTKVQAFTAAFPGFEHDESCVVSRFAKTCHHIEVQSVQPNEQDLPHTMKEMAYALGEPVFSATVYAHYELLRAVHAAGIKVALNGQGSDEAFGGYDRYYLGYVLLDALLGRPSELLTQLRAMNRHLGYSWRYIAIQTVKSLLTRRFAAYLRGRYQECIIPCLEPRFVANHYQYLCTHHQGRHWPTNFDDYHRDQLHYFGFNQILHYEDHSSMAHSVEIRSPFIDYRVMEFAFSLPTSAKYDQGVTKRVVRHAYRDFLAPEIVDNPRKIGFTTPMHRWLQDARVMAFVRETLGSSSFSDRAIWNAPAMRKKFDKPSESPQFPFWRVLNFHLWADAYRVRGL